MSWRHICFCGITSIAQRIRTRVDKNYLSKWINNPFTCHFFFTSVKIKFRGIVCFLLSDEIHKGSMMDPGMDTDSHRHSPCPVLNSCWLNNLSERRWTATVCPLRGQRTKVNVTHFQLGWLKTDNARCCAFWWRCHMPSCKFLSFLLRCARPAALLRPYGYISWIAGGDKWKKKKKLHESKVFQIRQRSRWSESVWDVLLLAANARVMC